jgi:hypothetical protein
MKLKHRPTVIEAHQAMSDMYGADECGNTNTPEYARNKNIVMAFMEDRYNNVPMIYNITEDNVEETYDEYQR